MTRPCVRKRASKNCVRKPARPKPRAKGKKRGVKPGTPSWRRFNYTPDLIADCRRRYEDTPETDASIARDYGCSARTIGRLAEDHGWIKYASQRLDLPAHVRLRRQVEEMAAGQVSEQGALPPPKRGRVGVGVIADSQGTPTRTASQSDLPLAGGGKEETLAPTITQALHTVQGQLDEVAASRASAKTPFARQRIAHTLASLTTTLRGLQAMQAAATAAPQSSQSGYAYDDTPADLDEFRRDLARRIDAFMESRPDDGNAGEPAAGQAGEA